jgi:hypothetical protein
MQNKTVIQVLKEMNETSDNNEAFDDFIEKVKKQLKLPANWKEAPNYERGDGMSWFRELDKKVYINLDPFKLNKYPTASLEVVFDKENWGKLSGEILSISSFFTKFTREVINIDIHDKRAIEGTVKAIEHLMKLPMDAFTNN